MDVQGGLGEKPPTSQAIVRTIALLAGLRGFTICGLGAPLFSPDLSFKNPSIML